MPDTSKPSKQFRSAAGAGDGLDTDRMVVEQVRLQTMTPERLRVHTAVPGPTMITDWKDT